jgi:hypothetical protein
MPTQIIIALCEGPHDVSFINRILKTAGFESNESNKIGGFPPPMGGLLTQEVIKTEVQELNLSQVKQGTLPLNTLQKGDNFIFLYSMHGDGKKIPRQSILTKLKLNVPEPGEIKKERLPEGTMLSVVYFFDADAKGVAARLTEVRNEVREIFTSVPENAFPTNGSYATYESIKLGSYIFTGQDNDKGKLEDILLPLMRTDNVDIFNNANTYIENHYNEERTLPLKLSVVEQTIVENRSNKNKDKDYDLNKSLIGITGQLQRSGKPNTAYISDTDYLNLAKISADQKCQAIITFFNNFMNNI